MTALLLQNSALSYQMVQFSGIGLLCLAEESVLSFGCTFAHARLLLFLYGPTISLT